MILFSLFLLLIPTLAFAQNEATVMPTAEKAPMTDIHDIVAPVFTGLSGAMKETMVYGGVALLVLGLLLFGLWLWFRRKQGPKEAQVFVQPPEVMAKMAFDRLEPLMHTNGKAFYFELSEAVRHYIKGRFAINAPEMTAEEFLASLSGLALPQEESRYLKQLTAHAEPVKFAGQTGSTAIMTEDLEGARHFVTRTTQVSEGDDDV